MRCNRAENFFFFDEQDLDLATEYIWSIFQNKTSKTSYVRSTSAGKEYGKMLFHSVITGYKSVEHIDGNGLNNRHNNLRDGRPNNRGRTRFVLNTIGSAGISRHTKGKGWYVYWSENCKKKTKFFGDVRYKTFDAARHAAATYRRVIDYRLGYTTQQGNSVSKKDIAFADEVDSEEHLDSRNVTGFTGIIPSNRGYRATYKKKEISFNADRYSSNREALEAAVEYKTMMENEEEIDDPNDIPFNSTTGIRNISIRKDKRAYIVSHNSIKRRTTFSMARFGTMEKALEAAEEFLAAIKKGEEVVNPNDVDLRGESGVKGITLDKKRLNRWTSKLTDPSTGKAVTKRFTFNIKSKNDKKKKLQEAIEYHLAKKEEFERQLDDID